MNGGREAGKPASACRICLYLTGATLEQDAELLRRERPYVDLAELRADCLQPAELARLARFPALVDLPVILTLRRTEDGGRWSAGEAERRRLLRSALAAGGHPRFAFVDLEQDLRDPELEGAARAGGCRVIRSIHDQRGVPADLAARVRRLARAGRERGELAKAAVRVRGSRDQRRLAEAFHALQGVEKILAGMGEYGGFSRILAGKLGSWLSYCSPREEGGPGEIDPRTLVELYRFRQVGPGAALYGVVGNPIAHSRSPHIHNRGYEVLGLDAVYVPFLADNLPEFLRAAQALGVRGLSVTVPFKQQALRLARRAGAKAAAGGAQPGEAGLHPGGKGRLLSAPGAEARAVGAANTLLAAGGRFWRAANTDVAGFLAPLERGALAAGAAAVVLGAGGAARAVVHALRQRGLSVLILNRTPARARELARRFGCRWGALEAGEIARLGASPALIVQTTTVGLDGAGDPLPDYGFQGEEVVYDLVYGPRPTPFLQRARAAGCRTLAGEEMLQAQAAAQFLLFTGREYPA